MLMVYNTRKYYSLIIINCHFDIVSTKKWPFRVTSHFLQWVPQQHFSSIDIMSSFTGYFSLVNTHSPIPVVRYDIFPGVSRIFMSRKYFMSTML